MKVRDAGTAKFLNDRDNDKQHSIEPHRITELLAGYVPGNYRKDLESLASTGNWSMRLSRIIEGYRMCPIDDTFGERPHSLVSKQAKRAPRAKLPYLASVVRFNENRIYWSSDDTSEIFKHRFRRFQAVLQKN